MLQAAAPRRRGGRRAAASSSAASMYVYYCRTYEKAVNGGGERQKGGHVLRDTTSRGLCVQVWPPYTNECLLLEDLVQSCVRGKGGK